MKDNWFASIQFILLASEFYICKSWCGAAELYDRKQLKFFPLYEEEGFFLFKARYFENCKTNILNSSRHTLDQSYEYLNPDRTCSKFDLQIISVSKVSEPVLFSNLLAL